MIKITFMGAGSTVFLRNVLGDCIYTDALKGMEIALYDIDGQRLEQSAAILEAINKGNFTVVVVTHEHELVHKLARKYGNRVITLANGMVASDTADPAAARRYAAAMAEREEDDYEYDED